MSDGVYLAPIVSSHRRGRSVLAVKSLRIRGTRRHQWCIFLLYHLHDRCIGIDPWPLQSYAITSRSFQTRLNSRVCRRENREVSVGNGHH